MAPKDDDQKNERENRVQEMMKGYRRDHPQPLDEAAPHTKKSVPPGVGSGPDN